MIYLFYGLNDFLIKKEVDKISNSFDSVYDLETNNINDVLDDASTIPMFSSKKYIMVQNALFFSSKSSINTEKLEMYFKNPNPSTVIVFTFISEKLDERKKIVKAIRKKGMVLECNDKINLTEFVKNEFLPYKINYSDISLFLERTGNNLLMISTEIEKMKLYKDDLIITSEDILLTVPKYNEIDIFKFIDYIVNDNKKKSLELLDELLNRNEEPLKILITLSNQFRLMYQVKSLKAMGYSEKNMIEITKKHPYSIKCALINSSKYSTDVLLEYLYTFANIDYGIKSGKCDKNNVLYMFIINKSLFVL